MVCVSVVCVCVCVCVVCVVCEVCEGFMHICVYNVYHAECMSTVYVCSYT